MFLIFLEDLFSSLIIKFNFAIKKTNLNSSLSSLDCSPLSFCNIPEI